MNLDQAKAECERWLDYLKRQEDKSLALQKLAGARRAGTCGDAEARRRVAEINGPGVTVYDGARLADAVRALLKSASRMESMIFVFGSNLAGRHGKGAALTARREFGAEIGVGEGRTGQAYAIPTKDANLRTRSIAEIEVSYRRFTAYAETAPGEWFMLTPIGCGLAGYTKQEIGRMIRCAGVPPNVVLARSWLLDA